jgi:hypothetical protein
MGGNFESEFYDNESNLNGQESGLMEKVMEIA